MNLAEIETFLMIVKTKNITKTAETLFLSQPTVSHRLKSLEEELEVKLLIRKKGHKQIELTSQGEEFIPIAERWVSVWQEMRLLKNEQETLNLRIGCTDTLNIAIFSELYKEILNNNDLKMNMKINTHYSYEIYELLEKHEIDIGFVYHHLNFRNILAEPLLREKMYLVQGAEAGLDKAKVHTDEMDPDKEIFVSWETNYQIWHDQWVSRGNRPRVQVDTFDLLLNLLSDEKRWVIAPISVVERIRQSRPVQVSEIANKTQPPMRVTYKIKHKSSSEVTLKAVGMFEEKMLKYLAAKDWGLVK